MFTILHRIDGHEKLFQANHLEYRGPFHSVGPKGVILDDYASAAADAHGSIIYWGDVFVMNASGATVAKYRLGDPPKDEQGHMLMESH